MPQNLHRVRDRVGDRVSVAREGVMSRVERWSEL